MPFELSSQSLAVLFLLYVLSGALVWVAGTSLARLVDGISDKAGIGKAFSGMLLLGGITSLPEVATVSTSAATGNPELAVNNLLGSAAINLTLLAVADIVYGRDALTSMSAKPVTLLQGVLGMILMAGVSLLVATGDIAVGPVGLGALFLGAACVLSLKFSSRFEQKHLWEAVDPPSPAGRPEDEEERGLSRLVTLTLIAAAVILCAGFLLSITGDAIAEKTGLGDSLVGFVLVGFGTSLPELSSIMAALRLRRYELAIGDIFGTNLFNIALILLADLVYPGDPVLNQGGRFETVAALIAVVLGGVYVVGLLERRDKTVMRMGYDSFAVLLLFAAGLFLLTTIDSG